MDRQIPEELNATIVFAIVGEDQSRYSPPPLEVELLPVIVLFAIVGDDFHRSSPPPSVPLLPVIVLKIYVPALIH